MKYNKFLQVLKTYRNYPEIMFLFFVGDIFFWYIFFGTKLKYDELFLLAILLYFTIGTFIGIFIKISYRQIPNSYPEWAKTIMRIVIFLSILIMFSYQLNKLKIINL